MSLDLDPRQRAMLAEMGIRVFWPDAPPHAVEDETPVALAPPVAAPPVIARTAPAVAPPAPQPPASGGAAQPALLGAGDAQPEWLLLLDPPTQEEQRQRQPALGDAGKLLDNMLAALGLNRRQRVYIACVPATVDAAATQLLRAEVARLQPRIVLAMGRFAVQALLQSGEPPGRLRGRAHDFHGVPVVVTYHPAALLRTPADKGKAWADLCLAASLLKP